MKQRLLLAALLYAALAHSSPASTDRWINLQVLGKTVMAAGYRFDFGDYGNETPPLHWTGPIVITSPDGRACQVSDEVELIDYPIKLFGGHLLYVDTYSGSKARLFVVDASDCKIAWAGPTYFGSQPRIRSEGFVLPGWGRFRVGIDGIPVRQR